MVEMLMRSERLFGRELQLSDLNVFSDLQSNPNVMRFVGREAMNLDECKEDLLKVIQHYQLNDGFRIWGFFQNSNSEMVGTGAIISFEKGNEIGFRLREEFWGNGYGVEITKNLIRYGFESLNLDNLFAEVDQKNIHSVKVLDKTFGDRKSFWNEAFQSDDYYYELSKATYEKNRH